jgi:hypothetical protein
VPALLIVLTTGSIKLARVAIISMLFVAHARPKGELLYCRHCYEFVK